MPKLADQLRLRSAFDFRLLATATPYNEQRQQVADYDYIASTSQGVEWLGVLRMDVDNLGELFHHGLGEDATLSCMATLSGSLRLFFEAYVTLRCAEVNRSRREKVYLLYAGGDALFVVGSRSILPELAKRIWEEFREYVGGDQVTLSAGVAVEHEKYPLYRLADDAKHALDDQAKGFKRTDGREKDAIGFLGKALSWEQFAEVYYWEEDLSAMLRAANDREKVPRALLTRLMEISSLYQRNRSLQEGRRRRGGNHRATVPLAGRPWPLR